MVPLHTSIFCFLRTKNEKAQKGLKTFSFEVHGRFWFWFKVALKHVNDPSAGSPTETLLRLLLPLNGKV